MVWKPRRRSRSSALSTRATFGGYAALVAPALDATRRTELPQASIGAATAAAAAALAAQRDDGVHGVGVQLTMQAGEPAGWFDHLEKRLVHGARAGVGRRVVEAVAQECGGGQHGLPLLCGQP